MELHFIDDLFLNMSVIVILTFTFTQWIRRTPISPQSPAMTRLFLGVIQGAIGFVLMYHAIQIKHFYLDLRYIPIIVATLFGGTIAGLTTTVITTIGRFLLLSDAGTIGGVHFNILVVGIGCAIVMQFPLRTWLKWALMTLFSLLTFTFVFVLAEHQSSFVLQILLGYWILSIVGSFAGYYILGYLWNANRLHSESRKHAYTDALTGVGNFRKFEQALSDIDGAGITALLYVDIDKFKDINDQYGHAAGDAVLRDISRAMVIVSHGNGEVFRIGGDEFAILLRGSSVDEIDSIAESLIQRVEQTKIATPQRQEIYATVSVGIAHRTPSQSIRELMLHADEGLYNAKRSGRNQIGRPSGCVYKHVSADAELHVAATAENRAVSGVDGGVGADSDDAVVDTGTAEDVTRHAH